MKPSDRKQALITTLAILFFAIPFLFASCGQELKNTIDLNFDPETVPVMNTDSVTMQISDSGLIRYKVLTKTWEIFQEAKEPYWYFPEGLYMERFDTVFTVILTIKADTAWNYQKKKLWRLKGNVFARNIKNETYTGDEMFWDQQKQQVYSNVPVEIDSPGKHLLIADKFTSDQQMIEFEFTNVRRSKVYINENDETAEDEEEKKE